MYEQMFMVGIYLYFFIPYPKLFNAPNVTQQKGDNIIIPTYAVSIYLCIDNIIFFLLCIHLFPVKLPPQTSYII